MECKQQHLQNSIKITFKNKKAPSTFENTTRELALKWSLINF